MFVLFYKFQSHLKLLFFFVFLALDYLFVMQPSMSYHPYDIFSGSSRQFAGFSSEVDERIITGIWKRAVEFFPKLKELPLSEFSKGRKVRVGLRPYSESPYRLMFCGMEIFLLK